VGALDHWDATLTSHGEGLFNRFINQNREHGKTRMELT
jgi:hypothetical protein